MSQTIMRTDDFLKKLDEITLYGKKTDYSNVQLAENRKLVNKLCKEEIEYLRGNVTLTTLRRYRTDYRNAVKSFFDGKNMALTFTPKNEAKAGHIALKYLRLKQAEVELYSVSEKTRTDDYQSGLTVIKICNSEKLIDDCLSLLNSADFYEIVVGLALLTGRRLTEIVKTGEFEYINTNKVFFSGQLKTRCVLCDSPVVGQNIVRMVENKDSTDKIIRFAKKHGVNISKLSVISRHIENHINKSKIQGYEIFTLCDARLICQALQNLRKQRDFSDKTNYQTESIASRKANKALRNTLLYKGYFYFNEQEFNALDVKSLRDIWVTIAHNKYGHKLVEGATGEANIEYFASKMLGHSLRSTASHYMKFRL